MNVSYKLIRTSSVRHPVQLVGPCESGSFVKAFLQFLYCATSNLSQDIVDITNTSQSVSTAASAFISALHPGLDAGASQHYANDGNGDTFAIQSLYADDVGVVVGTSNTAVAVADDNLVTQVAHGSSAGQLVHYGSYGLNYTTGASSASFDLEREFRNDSGGSIVVAEIGVYAMSGLNSGASTTAKSFCLLRDVISPTVTVLDGEYLKVKYTITVSN